MATIDKKSDEIVLIADLRVLSIPIVENKEALIDLKDQSEIAYGHSPEIPDNQDYTKIRLTVYNKLIEAQKLLPQGLRFCLYEGYRSLNTQKLLFATHYQQLQKLHPEWGPAICFEETTKLVSPITNKDGSANIPPHSTGGAIDIYLINDKGIVDMGICVENWLMDVNGELSATNSNKISDQAKMYRKIMHTALESVDFVNYSTEYWHWSFGDRYWAYHKKADHAQYGTILYE
jgi:D-alanyl-D-alanine dipeptidase